MMILEPGAPCCAPPKKRQNQPEASMCWGDITPAGGGQLHLPGHMIPWPVCGRCIKGSLKAHRMASDVGHSHPVYLCPCRSPGSGMTPRMMMPVLCMGPGSLVSTGPQSTPTQCHATPAQLYSDAQFRRTEASTETLKR
jgi:hypothetical protein